MGTVRGPLLIIAILDYYPIVLLIIYSDKAIRLISDCTIDNLLG